MTDWKPDREPWWEWPIRKSRAGEIVNRVLLEESTAAGRYGPPVNTGP